MKPRFIVGIGASAGGLEALQRFFDAMPSDLGVAFVVVQHLAPDFKSLMDELLARHTRMDVHRVANNTEILADHIYLIPPRKEMVISGGRLLLTDTYTENLNLPIDIFLRSLAAEAGPQAAAVILSGTGSDGSRGVKAIHDAGGLVVVQSVESAKFDGMPNSAIATGVADHVMAPEAMGSALADYINHPHERADATGEEVQGVYSELYAMLLQRYGIDFDHYKPGTIARRIERRMALVRCESIDEYVKRLQIDAEELETLYRDLLIGVTEFFRDPEAWSVIEEKALPSLLARVRDNRELRLWVPGCATGEEPYSLAILLHEHLTAARLPVPVKIFATDVHKRSLEQASNGFYARSQVANLAPERRERYFNEQQDGYTVVPEIRRMVVFAPHNITADPPFTNIDFISCRNLLIYLEPPAQTKALGLFHFALNVGGHLVLGPSETLGPVEDAFETVDRRWRLFFKHTESRVPAGVQLRNPRTYEVGEVPARRLPQRATLGGRDINLVRAYDALMEDYMPPALLVAQDGELVHTFGAGGQYLHAERGVRTNRLADLLVPPLRTAFATALQRVLKEWKPVTYGGLKLPVGDVPAGLPEVVKIIVSPVSERRTGSDYILVVVEAVEALPPVEGIANVIETAPDELSAEHIRALEVELQYTKENLQATVEELETSNEELQATNEELMAANEELQSTNEELHSVNEELYTVNSEYEEKIGELVQLNQDMDNLIRSTDIGTVFLDTELRIRKFTPAAARSFTLLKQDLGRPIGHLHQQVEFHDLDARLKAVIVSGQEFEAEVPHRDGSWFLMRLHPYREGNDEVGGVVLTFVDITATHTALDELRRMHDQLQDFAYSVSHDLREPLRMIHSYCELLDERHAAALDGEAKEFLEFAVDGARRVSQMLDGLLKFSRVVSRGREKLPCSSMDSLLRAMERVPLPGEDVIRYDNLPAVMADAGQLTDLFAELLANAVRFPRADTPLQIVITGRELGAWWEFQVADNGVGVPAADQERVFRIFETVADAGSKRGNGHMGIGLAVAQRIVERHGGRIWMNDTPGGGLTVCFTLPAVRPASGPD